MNYSLEKHNSAELKISQDIALVLTASIDIKGMPKAIPTAAEQRQQDYFNTLKYYINNHPIVRKIIFIENSGWSLDYVMEAAKENPHNKEIEFISLNCNDFPRRFSKGYGECLLIEKGLKKSKLVNSVTHIAKITGRIYLRNLSQLLQYPQKTYDCYCDYKDHGWILRRLWGEKQVSPHCDTRFLVFSKQFYERYLMPLHQQHNEGGFCIETEVYDGIKKAEKEAKVISRFPIEPKFDGVAGHFGGKDYNSKIEKFKFMGRSLNRKILPWLHL